MSEICGRLGQTDQDVQEWLVLPASPRPAPTEQAFPRPAKRPDGSYIYKQIPDHQQPAAPRQPAMLYKKRAYEEKPAEGGGGPTAKHGRTGTQTRTYSVNQVAPKGKFATLMRMPGQKAVISWQDAPDDLFYRASNKTKKVKSFGSRKRISICHGQLTIYSPHFVF